MKWLKKSEGFTLLEILVAMNISAIIIGLIIVFFLFSTKFLNRSLKGSEQNWNCMQFFFLLNRTIRNSDMLSFNSNNNNDFYLITAKNDTIHIAPSAIELKGLYKIDGIKEISLVIKANNKIEIDYENGKLITSETGGLTNNIVEFDEIDVYVKTEKYSFPFSYLSPAISSFKFKDINENPN